MTSYSVVSSLLSVAASRSKKLHSESKATYMCSFAQCQRVYMNLRHSKALQAGHGQGFGEVLD